MTISSDKKTTQLKAMLQSKDLEFLMEAHNGLSSRIVQDAGFKGIWASGLAISASLGVRDNNEASWTQVLDVVEFMNDAVSIPILLDGDTGYGNFNNMRRLVTKLCQRGIAGVCIEDKQFPKTNSFIQGEAQPLADIEEFCGKIKAGKDSQTDSDFCIVARVEALIAGWGIDEALKRAEAYAKAGADAILIYSKSSHADQIMEFCAGFKAAIPVVIVPTKYYKVPVEEFRKAGISTVIWANHLLRAAITSMSSIAQTIYKEQSLISVEERIAPLEEVFRLQGAAELSKAEELYLTSANKDTRAIILAASRGQGLDDLTMDKPKCMLPIAGKPILEHLTGHLKRLNINQISVVVGYKPDAVIVPGLNKIMNKDFATTNELASLALVEQDIQATSLIIYGDMLLRRYILEELLERPEDIVMVVDSAMSIKKDNSIPEDRVMCSAPDSWDATQMPQLTHFWPSANEVCHGQWAGVLKVNQDGSKHLIQALHELKKDPKFTSMDIPQLLNRVIQNGHIVHVLYIKDHCINVNKLLDLGRAQTFVMGV